MRMRFALAANVGPKSTIIGRKFRRLLQVLSNHVTQGRKTLSEHTQACLSDIRRVADSELS